MPTGRMAWAMQISAAMFLPDAARPESDGLEYDAQSRTVIVVNPEDGGVQSSGGIGDWVVETVPGDFEVMPDVDFGQAYQLATRAP